MMRGRRAVCIQCLGLLFAGCVAAWFLRTFPLLDYVVRFQVTLGEMPVLGAVFYPMFYAGCNVLLLPAGIVAIGSGFFFGLWKGFLINLAGNVGGAVIAFFISRKLGRQWVARKFFKHRKLVLLDEAIGQEGRKIVFLSQVHPLFPTSLLNYLYGVTRIGFGTCMLWVGLGQAPGLFLYAYLGTLAQFGIGVWRGQRGPNAIELWFWIGGLVAAFALTTLLARLALRLLKQTAKELEPARSEASLV